MVEIKMAYGRESTVKAQTSAAISSMDLAVTSTTGQGGGVLYTS